MEGRRMSMRRTVLVGSLGWVAAMTLLHWVMNLGMLDRPLGRLGLDEMVTRPYAWEGAP